MLLDDLVGVIELLKERIAAHGTNLRENEIRTRMALIDPMLQALGWDTSNPSLVAPEYSLGGNRVDYALMKSDGNPLVLLEAKKLGESLASHQVQLLNYAIMSGISYAGLTDGDNWELYDVFQRRPLADKRMMQVSIIGTPVSQCAWMLSLLQQSSLATEQAMLANALPFNEEQPIDIATVGSLKAIDPQSVLNEVASFYGLGLDDLVARNRRRVVSRPRQVAMYLLLNESKLPASHVVRLLGGRDHSTVIHGAHQVNFQDE